MIFDGKAFAQKRIKELHERTYVLGYSPVLVAFIVGHNSASESYLKIKQRVANAVGITMRVEQFSVDTPEEKIISRINEVSRDPAVAGSIVQLPLPGGFKTQRILDEIPFDKDPDILSSNARSSFESGKHFLLPPVVSAVRAILSANGLSLEQKNIVIVGEGALVGRPIATWVRSVGCVPVVVTKETQHPRDIFRQADVIISGAGVPGLITLADCKPGVVLIDAGTSELPADASGAGKIVGDCDPDCAQVASFFTPVPGGVGPVVVSELFANLLALIQAGH